MKNCTPFLLSAGPPADNSFVTPGNKGAISIFQKTFLPIVFLISLIISSSIVSAQLGLYSFTGTGACPNQNPAVTSQPANASFSNITIVNAACNAMTNAHQTNNWNTSNSLDPSEYLQFTITPNAGYALNLTTILFTQYVDVSDPPTHWTLRSSVDNFFC